MSKTNNQKIIKDMKQQKEKQQISNTSINNQVHSFSLKNKKSETTQDGEGVTLK